MALIAMTTADAVEYVSSLDPSKTSEKVPVDATDASKGTKVVVSVGEGATIFKLRSLDVFLMGYIYDNASHLGRREGSDEVGIHTRMNQTNIACVRNGLAGCTFDVSRGGENTRDPNVGKTFDFVCKNKTLAAIAEKYGLKIEEVQPAHYDGEEGEILYLPPEKLVELGLGKAHGGVGYEKGVNAAANEL